jgi:hypothetical protein
MTSTLLQALKLNSEALLIHPFIQAAKDGNIEECERWLNEPKVKVDQRGPDGEIYHFLSYRSLKP